MTFSSFTIDSITDQIAKLETPSGDFIEVPVSNLPDNAKEGDILRQVKSDSSSNMHFIIDHEQTEAVRNRVRSKLDALRARSKQ
ncbi:DUF3006 domain-containing protein [Spirochaeta africana]|uniref:DUF3006 domain-containing protein n=1 Tax=Spirochaeta africana (strain ATCC 700263 / DSM 8902 / Z-7692) TaxID=889378 RepID=H9UIU4_SPIAZ|nr:DUF3006 domain-containing protein [Spirochaeta africana]AFG37437.1 Protein of unknown function (DUF3006) [Spirochaeta africana DSM 8902]